MTIKEMKLNDKNFNPGEVLSKDSGYMHITITYNISGNREKIDDCINRAIENDSNLKKIERVNTTLYWQENISSESLEIEFILKIKNKLKDKLKEIFINKNNLSGETVDVFCMVGNIRGFAFQLQA